MLRTLRDLFDSIATPPSEPAQQEHTLHLATAVLLVEVMRADPQLGEAERLVVVDAMRRSFPLQPDETDRLIELAHEASRTASDFHQFTSVLNDRLGTEQKVRIVEWMWQVALSDGHLHAHEQHLIRRVADLLHVTHGQFIAAKLHAQQAVDAGPPAA